MTLRETAMRMLFAGGIETKSDAKSVPSTKLLVLENGVFGRAISIKKRNGYEVVDTIDDAIRTGVRDDELLTFTPNRCYSQPSTAPDRSDVGGVFSVVGTDRPLIKTGTQQLQPDHASLSGVTVSAWEDSLGGVWWSVTDTVTGRVFRAATQADALGQAPRCVSSGANLHVYYAVPTTSRMMVLVIDPTSPATAVIPAVITDDLDPTNPAFDACQTNRLDTPALLAWHEALSDNIRVGYVASAGVLGGPLSGHPSVFRLSGALDPVAPFAPIAVAFHDVDGGSGDIIALAYVGASVAFLTGGSLAAPISIDVIRPGPAVVDAQRVALALVGDTAWVAWEEAAAQASERFVIVKEVSASLGDGAETEIRSVGLASRAWAIDEDAFAVFVHDTTFFNTYIALRLSDFVPVGRLAPGLAAGAPLRRHLSSVHVVDDVARFALPVRTRLAGETGTQFRETGVRLFALDFESDASHQTAQLGRGLYMGGACPMHYDGRVWTEQGFHVGPELIVATPGVGGSMTSSTTVEYRAWYEHTDAQGEVHRGPTSIGTLVTMGGVDTQVTLTVPMLRVTRKTNVQICVARSRSADTGKTAEMFRVTSLDPTTDGAVNGFIANDPTVDSVTFIDRMSDDDLEEQEPIYTDGGILSNDPAPLGSSVARGKSRLFFTDPSDGNVIRYSQTIEDGFGLECPPELTIKIDPFGGDITALAVDGDRIVVFKTFAIFVFAGDGPLANGDTATSGFSTEQLLTSDVGCTDPASIVLTPGGHMFKTAKGIYAMTGAAAGRDQHQGIGAVQYVGAPVEAFNAQSVRRATVMPDRTQVVFLTDDGLTLLYDYLFGQWSTFTNHEGLDAAVVSGRYHYLRADGRLFRETPGVFSDAGTRIRLRFETAWLHIAEQLQGFQRFWYLHLLGTWVSPHQLGVQYQTDYTPGWTDAYWLDATGLTDSTGWITGTSAAPIGIDPITGTPYGDGIYGDGPWGGVSPDLYQWRVGLNEKGQSIQFRFEDFEAVGYLGGSFELTELLLTGGIKGNAPRPFTAARSA
jgi:hypothetical protein